VCCTPNRWRSLSRPPLPTEESVRQLKEFRAKLPDGEPLSHIYDEIIRDHKKTLRKKNKSS